MAVSAGILLYRRRPLGLEVFLVHPGGPFWARKDDGAWTVPKGLVDAGEDELAAARREFREETGFEVASSAPAQDLGEFRQPSGKRVRIWAVEGDCDPGNLKSNGFEMEWPPRSGRMERFPEVDRGGWFAQTAALAKIIKGQRPALESFYARFG
jgi:predicted NUDIX family NTP pyrophosphohydrolase